MRWSLLTACSVILFATSTAAQTLYKYRGVDGEWIYTDRKPADERQLETRPLNSSPKSELKFDVTYAIDGREVTIMASNPFYIPVEIALDIERIEGISYPHPDESMRWVVPPLSQQVLLDLDILETATTPSLQYRFTYLAGDPAARHAPGGPYRVPYAIGVEHRVTQAYPEVTTHRTPDSYYAVDIEMPIGTDIVAARGGVVFDIAGNNFEGGTDPAEHGRKANVIRILHEDGSYAIYAHLNWNSIRVKPGDSVQRGQYIADSGNTGYSSGPHLHFAVVRNSGMKIESLPITFAGNDAGAVTPAQGMTLTAY